MGKSPRVYKLAEQLRTVIANELLHTADPRFSLVTITGAVVTPDMSQAKVYWTVHDRSRRESIAEAFESARGHFRTLVARSMQSRATPALQFLYDASLDEAEHMDKIFAALEAERHHKQGEDH